MGNRYKDLVYTTYSLPVDEITPILSGVGGETYLVKSQQKNYVLKFVKPDAMNHPEIEAKLCRHFLALNRYRSG